MQVKWDGFGINFLRETEVKRKLELRQIKTQAEILSTFLPDAILSMSYNKLDEPESFVGVLLFADVSGFTPLCEKYYKTGKGGVYRLTATLNAYIGALVEVITFYGGDIFKFSGDAFLAVWKVLPDHRLYEVIHRVIVCSLFIQSTLGSFETEVKVLLKVKLAIACSNLIFSVIGNEEHRTYIVIGEAIMDVKNAEHCSISGEVVVAPSAWGHVAEDNYEVTFGPNGNVKVWNVVYLPNQMETKEYYNKKYLTALNLCVKHLEHRRQLSEKRRIDDDTTDSKITGEFISSLPIRKAVEAAATKWIPKDLNTFIVRPVQSQVEEKQPIEYLTEMRQVTIQFINIVPTTYQENKLRPLINKSYQIICKIVSQVRGVVNKLSTFDKDCMILVLFGLRGIEHEIESQNALKSAFNIHQSINKMSTVKSISIGITIGMVYCGVVGHPFRQEYTVIGDAVNKAARIMCAYEGKVTCDHETYRSCKLSSLYFKLQASLKLKGIADAGHIFEYNEKFEQIHEETTTTTPIIGRDVELRIADIILLIPRKVEWTSLCYRGEPKVGKTKLLKAIVHKYMTTNNVICQFSLNEALQRAYYTVSVIYRQVYDNMANDDPKIIKNLPRDLWNFNEIRQLHSINSFEASITDSNRLKIKENFLNILSGRRRIIVFIDNFQCIDAKSLELLITAIDREKLNLICAACFEENIGWTTIFKMSLCLKIKIFGIEPLSSQDTAYLICSFLSVRGVSKKLIILVNKTCEGRPGWIQACLLKMINNGELEVKYATINQQEYVFLEESDKMAVVLVAGFSNKYLEHGEETSTAVTLDLFDSFSPYKQLIIKTAAVLGEIFTRTILIVLLKYPNETLLAVAIKTLFEEEIFDCASRYVNSGGLQDKQISCLCFMEDVEYEEINAALPRYAFCKVLHFKSRNIRMLAYDLLPQNQKKELHLVITDLLENQNNMCPNCIKDNSSALIHTRRFNEVIQYCTNENYTWQDENIAYNHPAKDYKQVVRELINQAPKEHNEATPLTQQSFPTRKLWDPSVCFCLEILTKIYRDLIHHSHCAQNLGKKIFFMLEYCNILFSMSEHEECIPILSEASELCMVQISKSYVFTESFKKMMMGRIHCLLGNIYHRLGNISAAKNHAILSLRQYDVPMISFKYSLIHILLNKTCFLRMKKVFGEISEQQNPMIKLDFAHCLSLVSNIYASEGCWNLAKQAALRSIYSLKTTNPNIQVLCDIYSNAFYLFSFCGDHHFCECLERTFNQVALRFYTNNRTQEIFYMASMIAVLFLIKALGGDLVESVLIGYRAVSMALNIQAHTLLLEIVPILVILLQNNYRIDDAVYMARIMLNIGRKYQFQGYVVYYSLCLEIILECNFYVEPFEEILKFACQYLDRENRYVGRGNKLIVNLYRYYLRIQNYDQATYWKNRYNRDELFSNKLNCLLNQLKYVECILLEQARSLKDQPGSIDVKDTLKYLNHLKIAAKKTPWLKPRYYLLQAYYFRICNKRRLTIQFLKKARKWAKKQQNVREECCIMLHSSCWFVDCQNEQRKIEPANWKTAKTFNEVQCCNILYRFPAY